MLILISPPPKFYASWTRNKKIFKRSPRPHPATDFLQTTSFGKLMTHIFQKYVSAKVPRGGEGFDTWPMDYYLHEAA